MQWLFQFQYYFKKNLRNIVVLECLWWRSEFLKDIFFFVSPRFSSPLSMICADILRGISSRNSSTDFSRNTSRIFKTIVRVLPEVFRYFFFQDQWGLLFILLLPSGAFIQESLHRSLKNFCLGIPTGNFQEFILGVFKGISRSC